MSYLDPPVEVREELAARIAEAEAAGAAFYTTVADAGRWRPLSGPFPTEAAARADLDRVRDLCQAEFAWAWFYGFGTASVPAGRAPLPVLYPLG